MDNIIKIQNAKVSSEGQFYNFTIFQSISNFSARGGSPPEEGRPAYRQAGFSEGQF